MQEFFRRLWYFINRRRFDQELANDMEFHREMSALHQGFDFGNSLRLREESREAWGWTWLDRLGQDLRYACRTLLRSPGFTLTSILMLAIGIGVNIAAFTFFNTVALKPLPIRNPESLLRFQRFAKEGSPSPAPEGSGSKSRTNDYSSDMPYAEMAFFRQHSRTLSAVIATTSARLNFEEDGKRIAGLFVTENYFTDLGGFPLIGRLFEPGIDDKPDAEPVVVLHYGFWQGNFGADPYVVGRTVRINAKPARIIGVASSSFSGFSMSRMDLWLPVTQQPYFVNGSKLLTTFEGLDGVDMWGRLSPGMDPKTAEAELSQLAAELRKQHPAAIWEHERLPSEPAGYVLKVNADRMPIVALIATLMLLILAVACANLGSLLLARGMARQREISIRISVGAGSGRLIRQLFTESLLLAFLGSAAALLVGYGALQCLLIGTQMPAWLQFTPDWRVMLFAVSMGFASAIFFGLTPALQLARQKYRDTIARRILIGAQVAASCILLIIAGLLVRALDRATNLSLGYDFQNLIAIDPSLASHGYTPANAQAYFETLQTRLRGVPGVESVALALTPPLGGRVTTGAVRTSGRALPVQFHRIDPQFFATMRLPLLQGRNLEPGDKNSAVISESLARRLWPGENPLGKQFSEGDTETDGKTQVVGVAASARLVAILDPDNIEVYHLIESGDLPSVVMLVKVSSSLESMLPVIASIAKNVDLRILPEIQTLKASFRRKMEGMERNTVTLAVLSFSALALACFGILGLVAYAVSHRTKEIGIRMALGAKPLHVMTIILRQFSKPVLGGLMIGTAGAAALSQLLRRELFGISNLDPVAYLAAISLFLCCAAIAALWPAKRALRIDPMKALRQD